MYSRVYRLRRYEIGSEVLCPLRVFGLSAFSKGFCPRNPQTADPDPGQGVNAVSRRTASLPIPQSGEHHLTRANTADLHRERLKGALKVKPFCASVAPIRWPSQQGLHQECRPIRRTGHQRLAAGQLTAVHPLTAARVKWGSRRLLPRHRFRFAVWFSAPCFARPPRNACVVRQTLQLLTVPCPSQRTLERKKESQRKKESLRREIGSCTVPGLLDPQMPQERAQRTVFDQPAADANQDSGTSPIPITSYHCDLMPSRHCAPIGRGIPLLCTAVPKARTALEA